MSTRSYKVLSSYYLDIPNLLGVYGSMVLRAIRCNNRAAGDRWLQAHASLPGAALPADTAVPLFAPLFLPANYISEDTWPDGRIVPLPGTKLIVSTTAATLTRDAAATVDISADVDEFEFPLTGSITTVGDTTTARNALSIWLDSAGPNHLLRAEIANDAGADRYIQVHAIDAGSLVTTVTKPLVSRLVPDATKLFLSFGNEAGFSPYQQDADHTVHDGCLLTFSTTAAVYTNPVVNSGTIKASYKV